MSRIVRRDATSDVRAWDSWQEWIDSAESDPTDCPTGDRDSRSTGSDWHGASWADTLRLARRGWPEGLGKIERLSMALSDRIGQRISRPMPVADVYGDSVDVPAYLAGQPDCMVTWEESEHAGNLDPITRIGVNITVSSGITSDVIFRRGAAIVTLAECLELAGRRADIDAVISVTGGGTLDYRVKIKAPDAPAQLDQLAFALCHAGSLRRIGFSLMETAPKSVRKAIGIYQSGGYGRPTDPRDNDYDIYLPVAVYGQDQWSSDAKTQAWIEQTLKAQGVSLG